MELNEYQRAARATAIFPQRHAIVYPALGLANEAGEVLGKIKKALRDGEPENYEEMVADELGDVLWYVAVLADDLGYDLAEVAQMNVDKLNSRKERGVLGGSGDNR